MSAEDFYKMNTSQAEGLGIKENKGIKRLLFRLLPVALVAFSLVACVTTSERNAQRVDLWSSRIGHYTYGQMVLKHGPPAKQKTLADGDMVATWSRIHMGLTEENGTVWAESITLTFDAHQKLKDWAYSPK
jgi:hypothetical protein